MDIIKEKIEEIVEKIKNDKDIASKFQKDPVKTIEGLIGMDLPDAQVQQIIDAVKAKIDIDKIGDVLGGLGGLFCKK